MKKIDDVKIMLLPNINLSQVVSGELPCDYAARSAYVCPKLMPDYVASPKVKLLLNYI